MNRALFDYAGHDPGKMKSFCFGSYWGAVLYDPRAYARKVFVQFTYFLWPTPRTFFKERIDVARELQYSTKSLNDHRPPPLPPEVDRMERQYEEQLSAQVEAFPPPAHKSKRHFFIKMLTQWAPPAGLLTVVFLTALLTTLAWPPLHKLRPAGWAALVLLSAPLANAFGICIVHALDIGRYRVTFGGYLLFALTAMTAFILLVLGTGLWHLIRSLASPPQKSV
jgi:hypothetical protein